MKIDREGEKVELLQRSVWENGLVSVYDRERDVSKLDIWVGSGCGSVERVVVFSSRGLQFESSHRAKIYIENLLSTVLKSRK